jgi:hypothetical protein
VLLCVVEPPTPERAGLPIMVIEGAGDLRTARPVRLADALRRRVTTSIKLWCPRLVDSWHRIEGGGKAANANPGVRTPGLTQLRPSASGTKNQKSPTQCNRPDARPGGECNRLLLGHCEVERTDGCLVSLADIAEASVHQSEYAGRNQDNRRNLESFQ